MSCDIAWPRGFLSLPFFLGKEIFEPLELKSSRLGIQGLDAARVVRLQTPDYQAGGTDFDWNSRYWHEFGAPWGGMVTSPRDFATFCQMMLNGGILGKTRILSPASAR